MLSLTIELLSMTDTVSVCVERLQGTAPLVSPAGSSTAGKNKAQLQFDARLTDPALMEIDKDRTSVTSVICLQNLWRTALIKWLRVLWLSARLLHASGLVSRVRLAA